ncbi:cytochrome P450 [Streptomyces sp. CB01201]|uniref:cytochrome P450 n=1 Tax=Streptomyces sp. CB01201 TaxID=2020324 RepID=UPI000C27AF68|nr:cytochrome P450 [Streptomyces sp. CB01201]PJN02063.1 cytochrome P450 [Streptomyces sp. CB01201]
MTKTTGERRGLSASPDGPAFPQEKAPGCPFDPPPGYRLMRAEEPVARATLPSGQQAWILTAHEDVRAVLEDPRFSADSSHPGFPRMYRQAVPQVLKGTFLRMDGAEHLRYRRMLAKDFTGRRAAEMRPRIEAVVEDRLDRMTAAGDSADLMETLAYPVPSIVVCELLGVPQEISEFLESGTRVLISGRSTPEEMGQAKADILGHLEAVVAAKEKQPGDDLISRLLAEQVAPGHLDREEVAVLAWLLLAAGHHTTATMIGTGTLALLQHPDQLAALRADPSGYPDAVDELLRHQTAMQIGMNRVAVEDAVIGGREILAGEGVVCQLAAANRDPDVFSDPDRLDVTRTTRGHVAFGHGPHQCLGQTLARVELQITLSKLFERCPGLRLAVPLEEVPFWHHLFGINGVQRLPVTW